MTSDETKASVKERVTVYSYFNKRCRKEASSLCNQAEREYGYRNGNSIVGRLAMASESLKVCLRVLKKGNKSRYDTYSVQDVLLFIVSVLP